MKTLPDYSREIGKYDDFFNQKKLKNRPYFDRLQQLGKGDLAKGFYAYHERVLKLRNKFADIYFYLKERGKLSNFSQYLYDYGLYRNKYSFIDLLPETAFSSSDKMKIDVYDKYLKITHIYSYYVEEIL